MDDQFPDHPKVIAAGPLAKSLFVDGLCYCNRLLTDGLIPRRMALRLADDYAEYTDEDLAQRLVDVGLWETCEDGYRVHDYLDYQPSAEKVKAERTSLSAKRAAAGRAGAAARWQTDGNGNGKAVANEWQTDGPVPSRPVLDETEVPIVTSVSSATAPRAKRKQQVPDDFYPDDAGVNYALAQGMPFEQVPRQVEKFVNHHRSKGTTFLDVAKAWQTWAGNYQEFGRPRSPTGSANGTPDFYARAEALRAAERNQS
ncbi:hypothetical protein [Nocardioides sp.]|uniref:hypothetical protein n=1 Tax=Nocardioides sp. TaxID=35761 RepID=UPI002D80503B|nr:hypothetical protein [Nocardioides sp.]